MVLKLFSGVGLTAGTGGGAGLAAGMSSTGLYSGPGGASLSAGITSLVGALFCPLFSNTKFTDSYELTTTPTTTVNNTLLERIDKKQHLLSDMVYFYKPPPTPHIPSARRTCTLLRTLPIEESTRGSVINLLSYRQEKGSCVRRSHHTPERLKLASHWIMRRLSIVLLCSVVIYLLLYDKIIFMLFMHHSKLEYVEQMHIMSLPINLHQTDVSCSH